MVVLKPVVSDLLSGFSYQDGKLYVTFGDDRTEYVYYDVDEMTYDEMLASPDPDGYFGYRIQGFFDYTRLDCIRL